MSAATGPMRFHVEITRKAGLADPEGATTTRALRDLGFVEVGGVHFGRTMVVEVEASDENEAQKRVDEMCRRLLANPVIEDYTVERIG